jgi:hypothetical protein
MLQYLGTVQMLNPAPTKQGQNMQSSLLPDGHVTIDGLPELALDVRVDRSIINVHPSFLRSTDCACLVEFAARGFATSLPLRLMERADLGVLERCRTGVCRDT